MFYEKTRGVDCMLSPAVGQRPGRGHGQYDVGMLAALLGAPPFLFVRRGVRPANLAIPLMPGPVQVRIRLHQLPVVLINLLAGIALGIFVCFADHLASGNGKHQRGREGEAQWASGLCCVVSRHDQFSAKRQRRFTA